MPLSMSSRPGIRRLRKYGLPIFRAYFSVSTRTCRIQSLIMPTVVLRKLPAKLLLLCISFMRMLT